MLRRCSLISNTERRETLVSCEMYSVELFQIPYIFLRLRFAAQASTEFVDGDVK
jgi:hypothetical protein